MRFNFKKTTTLGLAVGALALGTVGAQAQTATSTTTTTVTSTTTPVQVVPVTGTVLRYYTDRSGFVTAMDVQTTDGIKWVRFSPGMAQRVVDTYPVGSTATVYVTQGAWGWDLAGIGPTMPDPAALWAPYLVTDLDLLKSSPYTTVGAKSEVVSGSLTGYVADENGEVLAIVVDGNKLIRVPAESRQHDGENVPEGKTPLFANSDIYAVGYKEAPRYGSLSPYETRLIATSIVVNGRSLGAKGFGKVKGKKNDTLFNWNITGMGAKSPEEVKAGEMGYVTYAAPGTPSGTVMVPAVK